MNQHFQKILDFLQQADHVTAEEKAALLTSIKDADSELATSEIKLKSTEKEKLTNAVLLKETIQELEQKRKAVEAQNKELEIEAALEKVRSRAMAMYKSEEVMDVAVTVYDELQKLDFKFGAATIIIIDKETGYMEHWLAGFFQKNHVQSYPVNNIEHPLHAAQLAAWRKGEKYVSIELSGAVLKAYAEEMFMETGYKNLPDEEKSLLLLNENAVFNLAYMKHGALMWAPSALSSEKTIILQRFAKVFEQTYTRFLDLQKAEAQAREAQIELALEKVLARTMAMQKSEDVAGAVAVIFEELDRLSIGILRCGIGIINNENRSVNVWTTSKSDENKPIQISGDESMDSHPLLQGAFNAWLRQEEYSYVLHGKDLTDYYKAQVAANFKLPDSQSLITVDEHLYQYYFLATFQAGGLFAFRESDFTEEAKRVMKRFAGVFNLTYKRFLDLQKAEAQARESQIQLALERVRARTMAMQKSEELTEVAAILFKQVSDLGIKSWTTGFNVWSDDNNSWIDYVTNPQGGFIEPYTIDATQYPMVEVSVAKKRGDEFIVRCEEGEQLAETYRQLSKFGEQQYKAIQELGFQFPEKQYEHFVFASKVSLMFITYEPVPEAHDIFKRFGKVFEQTYTRFLDLKKAEAQAREAQIEAALERVRSRTMAMQKSDELTDVAGLLFAQVSALGIKTWTAGFNVWSEDNNSYVDYITSPQGGFIEPYTVHTEKAEALKDISDARKSGVEFDVQYVEGEKIKQLYCALTNLGEKQFEIMLQDGVRFPSHQYEHFVFGSKVSLMFITYEPVPEAHDIFKRLGKVFEQTYTRFLDLQKAEAQAREAQIETSLERVRSRTMGMQQSHELGDVATVLFKELNQLVENLWTCGFVLCAKDRGEDEWWLSTGDGFIPAFYLPNTGDATHVNIYDAWKKGESYHTEQLEGEALQEHYDWLMNIPVSKKIFDEMIAAGNSLPTWQKLHCAYFSYGYLVMITQVPCPEEQIFKRFAQVFDQTYTRFLDLQKAEAQSREAQIEL